MLIRYKAQRLYLNLALVNLKIFMTFPAKPQQVEYVRLKIVEKIWFLEFDLLHFLVVYASIDVQAPGCPPHSGACAFNVHMLEMEL